MCQWILFGCGLLPLAVVIVAAILRGKKLVGKLPDDDYADKFIAAVWKKYFNSNYPSLPDTSSAETGQQSCQLSCADVRQQSDRLLTYLERVVDRTINKARGILPFNSIIMALLSIEKNKFNIVFSIDDLWGSWVIVYFYAVILGLAVSSYKCLQLFLVSFGRSDDYGKIDKEVLNTVKLVTSRSMTLERAVNISEISLLSGIAVVVGAEVLLALGFLPPPR
jgi:hypothetical protein